MKIKKFYESNKDISEEQVRSYFFDLKDLGCKIDIKKGWGFFPGGIQNYTRDDYQKYSPQLNLNRNMRDNSILSNDNRGIERYFNLPAFKIKISMNENEVEIDPIDILFEITKSLKESSERLKDLGIVNLNNPNKFNLSQNEISLKYDIEFEANLSFLFIG